MAFVLPTTREKEYARPERLADVMALIQVLALDEKAHRSSDGLRSELQGHPRSAKSWELIAEAHPEFFRVNVDREHGVSLISRHVTPKGDAGRRELSPEFVGNLLRAAVEMHDRQVRRAERWTYLIPIWVALTAGIFTLIGIALRV